MELLTNIGLPVLLGIPAIISFLVLAVMSQLLGLAAALFNWAVLKLVFEFSIYLGNSGGMLLAWSILRDIGNIMLLFGFIFIGLQTILNVGHFSVKKALPRLIIFAVLLNFSLFVAEAVIDTSNVVASALYKQAYDQGCPEGNDCTKYFINYGIASSILTQLNITTIWGTGGNFTAETAWKEVTDYATKPIQQTAKYVGLMLLVVAAFFVLFWAALLLIARGIHLALLMVVSPIGFAGMAIPALQGYAKKWWEQLINQSLFAPAFLLLLLVSLKMTEGLSSITGGSNNLSDGVSVAGNDFLNTGPLLVFALSIGFMIGALMMAKKFGVYGANTAVKNTMGMVTRAAGAPLAPYRTWFGQGSNAAARAYNRSPVARGLRSVGLGFVDDGIHDTLKSGANIKGLGLRSHNEQSKHEEARKKELGEVQRHEKQKKELEKSISEAKKGNPAKLEKALQGMSVGDIKTYMKDNEKDTDVIVSSLSTDKFSEIFNDKDLSEGKRAKYVKARYKSLDKAIFDDKMDEDDRRKEFRRWTTKDIEMLAKGNPEAFDKFTQTVDKKGENLYSSEQYDALKNSSAFTSSQRERIKASSIMGRADAAMKDGRTKDAEDLIKIMKPKQKAQLKSNTLVQPEVTRTLSHLDLQAIMAKDDLSDTEIHAIAQQIRDPNFSTPQHRAQIQQYLNRNGTADAYWQ